MASVVSVALVFTRCPEHTGRTRIHGACAGWSRGSNPDPDPDPDPRCASEFEPLTRRRLPGRLADAASSIGRFGADLFELRLPGFGRGQSGRGEGGRDEAAEAEVACVPLVSSRHEMASLAA